MLVLVNSPHMRRSGPGAGRRIAVAAALTVLVGACGSSSTVDIQSLGLDVGAEIQAGQQFELSVPVEPDTTIELVSAPPGVTASLTEAADGKSVRLALDVDADTPRGAYNVALRVDKDGKEYELGWPFDVVEGGGTASTVAGSWAGLLTVDTPGVGDVFASPSAIAGESSSSTVTYVLSAGDMVLAEGTIDVVDGAYSTLVEFTNTCCIEMTLEVRHPGEGEAILSIPVAYPESG